MNIKRIVPNIPSSDIEKSKLFYRDFLGLELALDMGWVLTFVSKSNPAVQLTILEKDTDQIIESGISITIEVDDIESIYKKAISSEFEISYPITNESWGVRRFFVKDPNGVNVNIMTHLT